MKYQHGLPETTPEFKQDCRDLMASLAHFKERYGIKGAVTIMNMGVDSEEISQRITIYGDDLYRKDGSKDGFWTMDYYLNTDRTSVSYIPMGDSDDGEN
jgi:hypothetical protein